MNEESQPLVELPEQPPIEKKKNVKRKIVWLIIAVLLTGGIWYSYKLINPESAGPRIHPLSLIPTNALYILETHRPYQLWSEVNKTSIWDLLEQDAEWSEYGQIMTELEHMLSDFDQALDILANRTVYVSGHPYRSKESDLLFIADLEGLGVLRSWMVSLDQITKRTFGENLIYEKLDLDSKETLYFSFVDNYLIASYTHTLVEGSLRGSDSTSLMRSFDFLDVHKKVLNEGLARVYLNYGSLYQHLSRILGQSEITDIKEMLPFKHSGFFFNVDQESFLLDGYSSYEDSLFTYLNLFPAMGTGGADIAKVIPAQTSIYMSFGFDSFKEFYVALSEHFAKDKESGSEYQAYTSKTEKFLDINLQEDLADWIDDEIAFIQFELEESSETAFVIKAKSASLATGKMAFLSRQIKRKTPVRFKTVQYRGYPINFMAVKGFFSLVLGKIFTKYDRPYFTILDEYIIFSDRPQVLRSIIDKNIAQETLDNVPAYQEFIDKLGRDHSALMYVQLDLLKNSTKGLIDNEMVTLLQSKTNLISRFPQFGFNISPSGKMFETHLLVSIEGFKQEDISITSTPLQHLEINFDSLFSIDPGEQIIIEEIEIEDLTAKKQSEAYEEGTTKYELQIKDGLKHGAYFEYHPSGELKIKGKYKNNVKEGIWKYYTIEGKLERKEKYRKGQLIIN